MLQMQYSLSVGESELAEQPTQTEPPVTFRYVPASHAVQLPDPLTALYKPAAQAVHANPCDPWYPMLQTTFKGCDPFATPSRCSFTF
eukprot:1349281-Rhodomonas_salina.1